MKNNDLNALTPARDKAVAGNPNIKKGDKLFRISFCHAGGSKGEPSHYNGKLYVEEVVIQSYGKLKGTYTYADGSFSRRNIFVGKAIFRSTMEEVAELLVEVRPAFLTAAYAHLKVNIESNKRWGARYAQDAESWALSRNDDETALMEALVPSGPTILMAE